MRLVWFAVLFGLVVVGAIDVQKTAIYAQRVVVTLLGGTPAQSYDVPFQPENYQNTTEQ